MKNIYNDFVEKVSRREHPYVIAEIGINHNGDLSLAERLINIAKQSGCDAVKFQKRDINEVYSQEFLSSARESPWGQTQGDQKRGLEFGIDEYQEIGRICQEQEIAWSASAWDSNSVAFLDQFSLPFNKIASAMISDKSVVNDVAERGIKTYISTGMSTYEMIDQAVEIFQKK